MKRLALVICFGLMLIEQVKAADVPVTWTANGVPVVRAEDEAAYLKQFEPRQGVTDFTVEGKQFTGEEYQAVMLQQQQERASKYEYIKDNAKPRVESDGRIVYVTPDGNEHSFAADTTGSGRTQTVGSYLAKEKTNAERVNNEIQTAIQENEEYIEALMAKEHLTGAQAREKAGLPVVQKGQPKDEKGFPVMGVPYTLE